MPVARWEFWSLATILIGTHGEDAEDHAECRFEEALASGDSGEAVVWREVVEVLPRVRQERACTKEG